MNEKIKELLAMHIAPPNLAVTRDLENQHTAHVTYTVSQAEMNTLLSAVIRECANVADGGWADPGHQIKQHFGVEG
jgi:hypothetical protein